MPLYPCVPNQDQSTAVKAVKPTGSGLADAYAVTLKSLSDLPTWAKIVLPIGLYLFFGDDIKRAVKGRR